MKLKTKIILNIVILLFFVACNERSGKEYKDIEHLLESLKKEKGVEFNKFPPRLIRAYLRYDGGQNEGLQDLMAISKLFIVVHIPKDQSGSNYKSARDEMKYITRENKYEKLHEMEIENINFNEFFIAHEGAYNELVLEIDEGHLYTIYCLKGQFSRDDIINASKTVTPLEFLRLNSLIRKN